MSYSLSLTYIYIFLLFGPLFLAKTKGYVLKCRRIQIGLFSISFYDVSYNHNKAYSVSAPQLSIQFHIPWLSDSKFLSSTIQCYEYKDNQHHIAISNINIQLSLFPRTPETLVAVTLDDFRVRVYHSAQTPLWMQNTRSNLIYTWLNGEYLRLDDFVTKIAFRTNTSQTATVVVSASDDNTPKTEGSETEVETQPDSDQADEAMVSAFASQWYIANMRNRLYSFESVHTQLRHSWDPSEDRGTFVFVIQNCSWGLCPSDIGVAVGGKPRPGAMQAAPEAQAHFPTPLLRSLDICKAPFMLIRFGIKLCRDPFSMVTLHSPRIDVTFDRFRLRDAELVKQGMVTIRRQYTKLQTSEYSLDFAAFFQEMILHGLFGSAE